MSAFHAYDIRGIYNVDFNKETAYKVGFFIPELLDTNEVLVGRDARVSSPEIHDSLIEGITDAGANVIDLGLTTTPMVYFATAKYAYKASVQITASHNPKEYNGMKVSTTNALPVGLDTGLGTIQQWIEQERSCIPVWKTGGRKGKVETMDILPAYKKFMSRYVSDFSGLKVAVDLSNGMSALVIKDILAGTGAQFSYICDTIDGTFPNHEANPLIAKNIVMLQEELARTGADLGMIYDGDADRVMFIDENGRFISPDLIIALMGRYWFGMRGFNATPIDVPGNSSAIAPPQVGRPDDCSSKSGQPQKNVIVLQDIRSSKAVGEYLQQWGAQVHTWKVGRAFAAKKLRELDGLFGGELAGHYYFKEFFYSDSGILASLIVLNIVSSLHRNGIRLSQAIAEIETYRNSGEINFKLEAKQEAMDEVKRVFSSEEKPLAIMDFDGYRLEFPHWWFNIRPSNTEPYLRFICEADTQELLDAKVARARSIIESFK